MRDTRTHTENMIRDYVWIIPICSHVLVVLLFLVVLACRSPRLSKQELKEMLKEWKPHDLSRLPDVEEGRESSPKTPPTLTTGLPQTPKEQTINIEAQT